MAYRPINSKDSLQKRQVKFFSDGSAKRFGIPDSTAARGFDLDIDSELEQEIIVFANETVSKLKLSAIDSGFRVDGDLVQSIGFGAVVRGNMLYTIKINMSDHWARAEYGRKRGKRPPLQPIIDWLGRTPSAQDSFFNKKKYKGKVNSIYDLARTDRKMAFQSAAFLISRAIGAKGTIKRFKYKGSMFVGKTINSKYMNDFSKTLAEKTGLNIAIYLSEL